MSYYTIYNLKQDVDANLHGGGVKQLINFYTTTDKARRALIGRVRPEELIRKSYLENALYPDVDKYAVPDDLKYDDVIELTKLSNYRNVDSMNQPLEIVYRRRFGQKRGGSANVMNIGYENGIKFARILRPRGLCKNSFRLIHDCDSLDTNGTWNVGGNIVNLKEDKLLHLRGHGSISFDINDSSTTGFIENFTLTPFDLYDFLQKGAVFSWFNFPRAREVVSIRLIMGSDPLNLTTDLYEATVNQPHNNTQLIDGWNLLKYMAQNLSSVGTPNPRALTYIRFEINTTGQPVPNCNMDNIVARNGEVYDITYNSSYMIMDATHGFWKKIANANSDIIVAEEDTYNLLVWETTYAAQKELYTAGFGGEDDVNSVKSDLERAYVKYSLEHKSEAILESDSTHVFGNMYDGYSDDPMPGFGNQYGQYGDTSTASGF